MKILLVIPTFNCANQIGNVINGISDNILERLHEVWVVDNQSSDETVIKAREAIGNRKKIHIKMANVNNSLGGTHKIAFNEAINEGYTHVAILHGDDQAKSEDLFPMIEMLDNYFDYSILGSRFSKGSKLQGYDKKRIVGNLLLNSIYSLALRRKLVDLGSGLNLFAVNSLKQINYSQFPNNLAFNYSLLISLVKNRADFIYYPIAWREYGQVSNTRNFDIFWKAILILKASFKSYPHWNQPAAEVDYGITDVY